MMPSLYQWPKLASRISFYILIRIAPISMMALMLPGTTSFGAISAGLAGWWSQNAVGLEHRTTGSGSASISLGFTRFLSFGVQATHTTKKSWGLRYRVNSDSSRSYFQFNETEQVKTYAFKSTLIIPTPLVSPFIFGGVANRYSDLEVNYQGASPLTLQIKDELLGTPTYGFGIAVSLGKSFYLKLTQTYTVVIARILDANGDEIDQNTTDSYTQVGLNYNFMSFF